MAQQSPFLESVTKFKIHNPKATQIFTENEFFQWSDKNFYRTSYTDMSSKVNIAPAHLIYPKLGRFLKAITYSVDSLPAQVCRYPRLRGLRPPHRRQQPPPRQDPH